MLLVAPEVVAKLLLPPYELAELLLNRLLRLFCVFWLVSEPSALLIPLLVALAEPMVPAA